MEVTLSLDKMTAEEKLEAIQTIWDDLCRNPSEFPSPQWHADVLDQREKEFSEGKDEFIDWEEARKKIIHESL